MWSWDQGRLDYFQFDNLKKIARFALKRDLRSEDHDALVGAVGLPFSPKQAAYKPWRNYARTFKSMGLVYQSGDVANPTVLATLLADDGSITTDEYFHFLAEYTSSPSPALKGWDNSANLRYPLIFALKFLLSKAAKGLEQTTLSEIGSAYDASGFTGEEDASAFEALVVSTTDTGKIPRQPAESLRVLAQISYLSLSGNVIFVSLSRDDARDIFDQLSPLPGTPLADGNEEIKRRTDQFVAATAEFELDYVSSAISDVEDAGFSSTTSFAEGAKTRKTHLVIERNGKIREAFFKANPSAVCDFCGMDTGGSYPWTNRILDVHHLLPLCSGARTSKQGTLLDDLVAVCPTCHRGVHRYYDQWLKDQGQKDFVDANQAKAVYEKAKEEYEAA
ncbi:HNH endonuclease [Aliiroseovarius crassostreae]|uniref:HNH endonuclease n=1 Tax=Aliiroseovarius crassostreae TaxID=154981 RepID=A0A9Q9HFU6_9RHOB|nr:HNH endonuclease [Aliiroseovarius crassostreae]UWP96530.1 HNH endonuclease [Aliiroseovarius crassostreae]